VEHGNQAPYRARLRGRVAQGQGEGAAFTRLVWARAAFIDQLGIDPFPGTLNLKPEDAKAWAALRATSGSLIRSPNPSFCNARAWQVKIAGRIDGAVVVPEVPGYPKDKIEIIAAVSLRDALGLTDGDLVELSVLARA